MNIFHDPVIITLSVNDPLVYIQTYDLEHSWSERFFLSKEALCSQLADDVENSVTECDLLNVCNVSRIGNDIRFRMFWLHGNYDDDLYGYQQTILIPVTVVSKALAGERIKYLSTCPRSKDKAQLFFTNTANEAIAAQDKLTRHAFRQFLRDHLSYSREEKLVIQRDEFVNGFYFFSTVSQYNGGIVLHEDTVIGKDGKSYKKKYFGLHT